MIDLVPTSLTPPDGVEWILVPGEALEGEADPSDWLQPHELVRWKGFASEERRRTFLMGRMAVRRLVAGRLSVSPGQVDIAYRPDGSPRLDLGSHEAAGEGLPYISICHTGHLALAVAADRMVGVDAEPVGRSVRHLHRKVLHPTEYEPGSASPDGGAVPENDRVLLLWTAKEAVLKAGGSGLRIAPSSLRSEVDYAAGRAAVVAEDGVSWHVRFARLQDHFVSVAVVVPDPPKPG